MLPGGRNLVIDSKVSLTAYTDYANAAADAERSAALKLHLASVRGHVTGLSRAGYQKLPGLETPDFVVMFVPVEPAFLLALQNDAELWADAYQQGILLVGPTTLLYIIRIVNVLWQQEVQARSVRDVMNRGAELYDKFVNFVSDLEAVGKSLRDAGPELQHRDEEAERRPRQSAPPGRDAQAARDPHHQIAARGICWMRRRARSRSWRLTADGNDSDDSASR